MGEKISVISSRSSRNQSRPMAGPSLSVPLISTLAPPSSVAPSAAAMPVSASAFFLRSIAEMTPSRIAADDQPLDQHPHEGHRVVAPQLGRGQHLREMQADHRPEGEQSEERRQDAAPPPRSEVGGIVVAKHLVDLFFEHASPRALNVMLPGPLYIFFPRRRSHMVKNRQKIRSASGTTATPRKRRAFMPRPFPIRPSAGCTSHRAIFRPGKRDRC